MTNENIRVGLGNADQARQERTERGDRREPRERSTFGADPATLLAWLEDDPGLWNDMSASQRISVGFHERQVERDTNDNYEGDDE